MIALASRVVNILKLLVTPPQKIVIRDIITLAYPEGQYTQMNRKSGGYKIHTENSENGSRMRRFTIHSHTPITRKAKNDYDPPKGKQARKSNANT